MDDILPVSGVAKSMVDADIAALLRENPDVAIDRDTVFAVIEAAAAAHPGMSARFLAHTTALYLCACSAEEAANVPYVAGMVFGQWLEERRAHLDECASAGVPA